VAESSGEEVSWEDIVKGYEIEKGRYVVLSPGELEALAPKKSHTIEIEEFVKLTEIDPIVWNQTYYLGPERKAGAEEPYALLRRAMAETGKVGIGRFVMRTKEHLATIRPMGEDLLGLETMYFHDEILGGEEVENLPKHENVGGRELRMAEQLIEAMSAKWEPEKFRDSFRDQILELVKRKARGEEIVTEPEREAPRVLDLMKALKASLEATRAVNGEQKISSSRAAELGALSKSELYERATEADVPGRSRMSKEQLIRALERRAS
jgi:DNA end-binding protein Ku